MRNGQRETRAVRVANGRGFIMQSASSEGNRLLELSDGLANIVERVGQSVVAIHGRRRIPSSGVIWRQGVVVTAAHTLRRDDGIEVLGATNRTEAVMLGMRREFVMV
jgi:serine protease Do